MFELGFSELLLIAVVALVVLGPERLPKVARSAGTWVGRIQNFIANVKTELSSQSGVSEFKEARESIERVARDFRQEIRGNVDELNQNVRNLEQEITHSTPRSLPVSTDRIHHIPSFDEPRDSELRQTGYMSLHQVSLHRQAMQRKRDCRPRPRALPQLRVRRRS